jgi:hypothetical protein
MKSISDSIAEKYIPNMPKSLMNNIVMDIFMNWKQRQHYAHLVEPSTWYNYNGVDQAWDANKQYTHALRNSNYKWMLFNMFSLPEPFDGVVKDGYYFIHTKNTMPCKGNGWYSRIIVDYLIEEGIDHSIEYQLIASETLDCDYFKKFVDGAIELCPDGFKYITNTFCGSLNIHDSKSFKVKSGCVQNHIINDCFKNNSSYIEFDLGDEKVYASAKINKTLNYENNMPMYSQVLDFGAVQFLIARHFGFCYGVENAIEISFKALDENPGTLTMVNLLNETVMFTSFTESNLINFKLFFIMDKTPYTSFNKELNKWEMSENQLIDDFFTIAYNIKIENALIEGPIKISIHRLGNI